MPNGRPPLEAPRLPEAVEARWQAAWGDDVVAAARRAIAQRPPLDLSFANDGGCNAFPRGNSLAPKHRRLDHHGAVTELEGFDSGQWWGQDLAALLPAAVGPGAGRDGIEGCE